MTLPECRLRCVGPGVPDCPEQLTKPKPLMVLANDRSWLCPEHSVARPARSTGGRGEQRENRLDLHRPFLERLSVSRPCLTSLPLTLPGQGGGNHPDARGPARGRRRRPRRALGRRPGNRCCWPCSPGCSSPARRSGHGGSSSRGAGRSHRARIACRSEPRSAGPPPA